jgi:ankyrin repeat protein
VVASICLSDGADPSIQDANGLTALELAQKKGNVDIVKVLITKS